MPRDIPLGNGSLLVAFDTNYQIRDLYWRTSVRRTMPWDTHSGPASGLRDSCAGLTIRAGSVN